MDSRFTLLLVSCICLVLTGCKAHIRIPYSSTTKVQLHQVSHTNFMHRPNGIKVQETQNKRKKLGYYQVRDLHAFSTGDNGQQHDVIDATYYQSQRPGPHKLLVILPIYGGSTYPARAVASTILRKGKGKINIIRVLGEEPLIDIESLEHAKTKKEFRGLLKLLAIRIKHTVIDVSRLVDWAAKQKETASSSITIIGFSKSSIVAGLIAQNDPNVTGAIFVMGGSNPADMLYHCDEYDIRKNLTRRFHWTNEKLLSVMHSYLTPKYNISDYPTRLDPCRVLIFDSYYDKCISKKTRDELWLGLGKPERISFLFGHRVAFGSMTIVGGYFMRDKILDFINQNNCRPISSHSK